MEKRRSKMKSKTTSIIVLFIITGLMASCSDSIESKTEHEKNAMPLTEEYLFGEWCHASTDRVDDADEIEQGKNLETNLNWEFKKRGDFLRQKSQRDKTMVHSRNWNIENGLLNIDIYLLGAQKVEILSRDEFIFHFQSMRLNIYRGKCK